MAAKFRKVDPRFWHDEKVKLLGMDDKLLALYMLTAPQVNRIGIFCFSPAVASAQIRYPSDTHAMGIGMGIQRVCDTLNWCFDSASEVLFFPTWWKYNGKCGPKTMLGNMDDLHDVPQTELIQRFASERRYLTDAEFSVLARVCHTHAIPMPYPSAFGAQEKEQEKEQEQEKDIRRKRVFVPPTVEEIQAYCLDRKNSIDPQQFHDHYATRGWIPKGYTRQMKDWRAAVRTWEKNNFRSNGHAAAEAEEDPTNYPHPLQAKLDRALGTRPAGMTVEECTAKFKAEHGWGGK